MSSLKDQAKAYLPKQTLNITDLDKVDLSWPIESRNGKKKNDETGEDETFTYKVICVGEEEYRTPNSVLEKIKEALDIRPDIQFIQVFKKGTGLATRYSIKVLEKATEEDVEEIKPELKKSPIAESDVQKINEQISVAKKQHADGFLTKEGLDSTLEQLNARLKELE